MVIVCDGFQLVVGGCMWSGVIVFWLCVVYWCGGDVDD